MIHKVFIFECSKESTSAKQQRSKTKLKLTGLKFQSGKSSFGDNNVTNSVQCVCTAFDQRSILILF